MFVEKPKLTNPWAGRPVATAARNRTSLVAFSPLLVVAGLFLFNLGQRAYANLSMHSDGIISRSDVDRVAREVCVELTGTMPLETHDITLQSAYSRRRNMVIREWNVVCDTAQGEYLLRINANTGRVYAINRVGDAVDDVALNDTTTINLGDDVLNNGKPILSRAEAENHARRYLKLLGISNAGLSTVAENDSRHDGTSTQWNFTFRRNVPGLGQRLLKISVSGKDGDLEDAWNPVYAL